MTTAEERIKQRDLSNAYISGELIFDVKYHHNSQIEFTDDGQIVEGWIVGVGPIEPEPIYTIQRADGGQDEEILESMIKVLNNHHEG